MLTPTDGAYIAAEQGVQDTVLRGMRGDIIIMLLSVIVTIVRGNRLCELSPFYRDSRLLSIGGGADEVMLGIICKYMDTLPKK